MIHNSRFWPALQLGAGLFLLVSAAFDGRILLGVLASLYVALATVALVSPTHKERFQQQLAMLQEQGLYPLLSEATDEDVRRLLYSDHKIFAIRLYRELHQVSLPAAIRAVKQMR